MAYLSSGQLSSNQLFISTIRCSPGLFSPAPLAMATPAMVSTATSPRVSTLAARGSFARSWGISIDQLKSLNLSLDYKDFSGNKGNYVFGEVITSPPRLPKKVQIKSIIPLWFIVPHA